MEIGRLSDSYFKKSITKLETKGRGNGGGSISFAITSPPLRNMKTKYKLQSIIVDKVLIT